MLSRFRSAARILLKGDPQKRKRGEIPAITAEEIAEVKQFFPRDKFFPTMLAQALHLSCASSVCIRKCAVTMNRIFFMRRSLLKSLFDVSEIEEWLKRKSNRWNWGSDLSLFALRASVGPIPARKILVHDGLCIHSPSLFGMTKDKR